MDKWKVKVELELPKEDYVEEIDVYEEIAHALQDRLGGDIQFIVDVE